MLQRRIQKIDKFYYIFAGVMLVLALVLAFTINGIFKALLTTQDITEEQSLSQHLSEEKLNEAHTILKNSKYIPLDLRF